MTSERDVVDFAVPSRDPQTNDSTFGEYRLILEEKIDEHGRRHTTQTSDTIFQREEVESLIKLLRKTNLHKKDLFSP